MTARRVALSGGLASLAHCRCWRWRCWRPVTSSAAGRAPASGGPCRLARTACARGHRPRVPACRRAVERPHNGPDRRRPRRQRAGPAV